MLDLYKLKHLHLVLGIHYPALHFTTPQCLGGKKKVQDCIQFKSAPKQLVKGIFYNIPLPEILLLHHFTTVSQQSNLLKSA